MNSIAIASKSHNKLRALHLACMRRKKHPLVYTDDADSGQNPQPVGWDETFGGAFTRAKAMRPRYPKSLALGIESGIFILKGSPLTLELAVIVLITPADRVIVTTSTGLVFPEKFVIAAESIGFDKTTVGAEIAKELGGDPGDPHSTLTNGKVSRASTLVDALVAALDQV